MRDEQGAVGGGAAAEIPASLFLERGIQCVGKVPPLVSDRVEKFGYIELNDCVA